MKALFSTPATLGAIALCVLLSATLASRCIDNFSSSDALSLESQSAINVLPSDAIVMGKVDVQELRDNTLIFRDFSIDDMLNNVSNEASARLNDFAEATGFDPTTDVSSFYFGSGSDERNAVMVIYGDLSAQRLREFVNSEMTDEVTVGSHRDIPVYSIDAENAPSFAFLNDEMIAVASNSGSINDMIDQMESSRSNGVSSNVSELVNRVAGSDAWFVIDSIQDKLSGAPGLENIDNTYALAARAIDQIAVGVDVTSDEFHFQSHLGPSGDISSGDLESIVKGVVAAAKTAAGNERPIIADMFDKISVSDRSGMVVVSANVSADDLKALESSTAGSH